MTETNVTNIVQNGKCSLVDFLSEKSVLIVLDSFVVPDGHFLAPGLAAALVTFPAPASFLTTDLMTPTATVCFMSRTAKRPRGG